MFKILLIITVMVAIFCLCVAIVAASRENELPDIEDVEFNLIIEERGSFSIE